MCPKLMSQETREKIGAAHRGKAFSKEHRRKLSKAKLGNRNRWKGGRCLREGGYIGVNSPGHPRIDLRGYVLEHVLVAERALGKYLPAGAVIHHFPKLPSEQLVICQDDTYHKLLHQRQRAFFACGHANWRKCYICKQYDAPDRLILRDPRHGACHRDCWNEDRRRRYAIRQKMG